MTDCAASWEGCDSGKSLLFVNLIVVIALTNEMSVVRGL